MASTPEDGGLDHPAEPTRLTFGPPPWAIRDNYGALAYFASLFLAFGLFFFYTMWKVDDLSGCVFALVWIGFSGFLIFCAVVMYASADKTRIAIDDVDRPKFCGRSVVLTRERVCCAWKG
jgi:hypothetical protein